MFDEANHVSASARAEMNDAYSLEPGAELDETTSARVRGERYTAYHYDADNLCYTCGEDRGSAVGTTCARCRARQRDEICVANRAVNRRPIVCHADSREIPIWYWLCPSPDCWHLNEICDDRRPASRKMRRRCACTRLLSAVETDYVSATHRELSRSRSRNGQV